MRWKNIKCKERDNFAVFQGRIQCEININSACVVCCCAGLDGSTTASERERLINQFNDPSNTSAWVFLLSTR